MIVRVILNDSQGAYIEYEHLGVMPQITRRSVDIVLTKEQVALLGIKTIGVDCGRTLYETIESVCIIKSEEKEG